MTKSTLSKSLVVPGTFVTIAASSPAKAFNKLDFPTFGLPIRATEIPEFINLPWFA